MHCVKEMVEMVAVMAEDALQRRDIHRTCLLVTFHI